MMKYGIDDRSNGAPESECLFVVMDAGEECMDGDNALDLTQHDPGDPYNILAWCGYPRRGGEVGDED